MTRSSLAQILRLLRGYKLKDLILGGRKGDTHPLLARKMALTNVNITFLGTASAMPSSTRNHSSLALRLNGDVWLFDCGEATQHRVQKASLKMSKIKKIFITHTHGEHRQT